MIFLGINWKQKNKKQAGASENVKCFWLYKLERSPQQQKNIYFTQAPVGGPFCEHIFAFLF